MNTYIYILLFILVLCFISGQLFPGEDNSFELSINLLPPCENNDYRKEIQNIIKSKDINSEIPLINLPSDIQPIILSEQIISEPTISEQIIPGLTMPETLLTEPTIFEPSLEPTMTEPTIFEPSKIEPTIFNQLLLEQTISESLPISFQQSTLQPTPQPTLEPTPQPTPQPTLEQTSQPTLEPAPQPTLEPTPQPTLEPTPQPTPQLIQQPTLVQTPQPTSQPTPQPISESIIENNVYEEVDKGNVDNYLREKNRYGFIEYEGNERVSGFKISKSDKAHILEYQYLNPITNTNCNYKYFG